MNTSPYTMNRGQSEDATFGENTMVAWIALDQMGGDVQSCQTYLHILLFGPPPPPPFLSLSLSLSHTRTYDVKPTL
jgi:hypothetical protein